MDDPFPTTKTLRSALKTRKRAKDLNEQIQTAQRDLANQ